MTFFIIKKMYFLDDVSDSSLFGSAAFAVFLLGLYLLLFLVLNRVLDSHEFMEDGEVFHFLYFNFDSILIIDIVSGVNLYIITQRLYSTVDVEFLIL